MTHEQNNDYLALGTIASKDEWNKQDLAMAFYAMGVDSSMFLLDDESKIKYLDIIQDEDDDKWIFKISQRGRIYYQWLTGQSVNDKVDYRLKKISINSLEVNKWLPKYALGIAIITGIVPFIMYFITKNDRVKSDVKVEQLEKLLQVQSTTLQSQQIFEDSLLKLARDIRDSLNKRQ